MVRLSRIYFGLIIFSRFMIVMMSGITIIVTENIPYHRMR